MKQFEIPELRVSYFTVEDILTLSGGGDTSEGGGAIGGGGAWEEELPR